MVVVIVYGNDLFAFAVPHAVDDGAVLTGIDRLTFNFIETIGRVRHYVVELYPDENGSVALEKVCRVNAIL